MISALYLHIPFCDHICAYCDFPKVLGRFFDKSLYIERLIEEIESLKIQDGSLKTIYIGGGTPSSLSEEELERLLSYLKKRFPNLDEFTIEANPESLDERKLSIMKRNGIDRISLGAESGNDAILAKMGRAHSRKDIVLAVERTRAQGIENINLDFIYGYPGESLPDALDDVSFAVSLKPKHLSFYSLQVEEGTRLGLERTKVDDDDLANAYDAIVKALSAKGYRRYEISNFALPDTNRSTTSPTGETRNTMPAAWEPAVSYPLSDTEHALRHVLSPGKEQTGRRDREGIGEGTGIPHVEPSPGRRLLFEEYERRFRRDFLSAHGEAVKRLAGRLVVKNGRVCIHPTFSTSWTASCSSSSENTGRKRILISFLPFGFHSFSVAL